MKTVLLASALLSPIGIAAAIPEISSSSASTLDLKEVFNSCPIIYSLLLALSVGATVIWLYTLFTLRANDLMPKKFIDSIRNLLKEKQYDQALSQCQREKNMVASIIASGLSARLHGPRFILETMQLEGKRIGSSLWQRISLLNEVAVIAPMIGLLGTVLGLFFAFYDANKSAESITSIFDGLGIAIGTTVVGLIVAILAMIFYTILKFRLVNILNAVENEAFALTPLIDTPSQANF